MNIDATMSVLANHSSLLFFSVNIHLKKFVYVNEPFKKHIIFQNDELGISDVLSQVVEADRDYLTFKYRCCLLGQPTDEFECRIYQADTPQWYRISFFLYRDEQETTYLIGHAENIDTHKKYSQNLERHNNKKNGILHILAHDLAGPIGNIQNLGELIKRETSAANNSRLDEYTGLISKISKSCIRMIRGFLNKEFLESAEINLLKHRIELVNRLALTMADYGTSQKEMGKQFLFETSSQAIYVEVDEDKFLQVIHNLISNSLKFTHKGGIISLSLKEQDHTVLISMADNGIGIPEKFHAHLFDEFSDASRTGLHGEQSVGLGMSIIKTIVEWHQGKIWFESEVDKGTIFYIEIPKIT